VKLAPILYAHGVDLIDVSSGGNSNKQKIGGHKGPHMQAYQAPLAKEVMEAIGATGAYPSSKSYSGNPDRLLVATVGKITYGKQAEELLDEGFADVVVVGRQFLKDPGTVWSFAEDLGDIKIRLASQIGWGFAGRGKKTQAKEKEQQKENK
jgi:2,4-dienoyl-CoA reductase-like NADH-dependent reductase (Old Yellow Enzyme family)